MTRLALALMWLLHWLPLRWLARLGQAFGSLLFFVAKERRGVTLTNLRLCFPELGEPEREALARKHFAAFGRSFLERGLLWWAPAKRLRGLVRIEGIVEKVSDEESDAYFHTRPLDSRIGAWASPQSQVISGRGVLVANAAKFGAKFMLQPPRPPHWGGYRLKPDNWQFWQGRKSRLHDRLRYTLAPDQSWVRERLAP